MNVDIAQLTPGVFGVSHGGGIPGALIRSATGSWAGHAFLYLGNGVLVEGCPPKARQIPADSYPDAIWAHRMWTQLAAPVKDGGAGWTADEVTFAQGAVIMRGKALIGEPYDFAAYAGFAAEVLHLRTEQQLSGDFKHDDWRVCSALVDDAETTGGVPMTYVPEDGPGLFYAHGTQAPMVPANLVAPGMLLGLAQRMEWI
jgi:hypothetical protein